MAPPFTTGTPLTSPTHEAAPLPPTSSAQTKVAVAVAPARNVDPDTGLAMVAVGAVASTTVYETVSKARFRRCRSR